MLITSVATQILQATCISAPSATPGKSTPGLSSHPVPEDIHAAQRAERHNSAANKFQLRESLVGALDNIALPQAHSFGCLERCCTANYSQ